MTIKKLLRLYPIYKTITLTQQKNFFKAEFFTKQGKKITKNYNFFSDIKIYCTMHSKKHYLDKLYDHFYIQHDNIYLYPPFYINIYILKN